MTLSKGRSFSMGGDTVANWMSASAGRKHARMGDKLEMLEAQENRPEGGGFGPLGDLDTALGIVDDDDDRGDSDDDGDSSGIMELEDRRSGTSEGDGADMKETTTGEATGTIRGARRRLSEARMAANDAQETLGTKHSIHQGNSSSSSGNNRRMHTGGAASDSVDKFLVTGDGTNSIGSFDPAMMIGIGSSKNHGGGAGAHRLSIEESGALGGALPSDASLGGLGFGSASKDAGNMPSYRSIGIGEGA